MSGNLSPSVNFETSKGGSSGLHGGILGEDFIEDLDAWQFFLQIFHSSVFEVFQSDLFKVEATQSEGNDIKYLISQAIN